MRETKSQKNKMGISRHTFQEKILGKNSTSILKKSRVAIIGIGGLGCTVAELLARSGVGNLILYDFDKVELRNIYRQTLFDENDVGKYKVKAAKKKLVEINKEIKINIDNKIIMKKTINNIKKYKPHVIIDCVDNLQTKFLLNDFCIRNKIPLVHGSAIKDRGTIFIVNKSPCLRCIYPENSIEESCSGLGVINTIITLIASLQTNESLNLLLKNNYEKHLIRINLKRNEITKIKVKPKKKCICQ